MLKSLFRFYRCWLIISMGIFLLASCADEYPLDDSQGGPSWLGTNIYDELKTRGTYTNFVKLIDDLNYKDVLSLTGSKTLFVANDSAFNEFFKSNDWGVSNYNQFTLSQKKMLLNFAMINNAYILKDLGNYYDGNYHEGGAMRRMTALSSIDSIPFVMGDQLPESKYWNSFRTKGLHIQRDNSDIPAVYFTREYLLKNGITNDDFLTMTGASRNDSDFYIFNHKVTKKDVVCKNGYLQMLNNVLVPPKNMALYVEQNPKTKIFAKLMNRFCAPYIDKSATINYRILHPEFTDTIFVRYYFASVGGTKYLPNAQHEASFLNPAPNLLPFDPGWNTYKASTSAALQADVAAMFVPTDDAMNAYFNSGVGEILKSRFGSWDNIPDDIIIPFLKRHMRSSLIESVPGKFEKMVDAENYRLPVEKSHIESSYLGVNGLVYTTNEVYPPVDYISVYSPVLLSDNSKIMNWAINISKTSVDGTKFAFYKLYLNSLVSTYGLLIPTDEYLKTYIDPIAYGQVGTQGAIKYWFNAKTSVVNATLYKYDKATNVVGDSVGIITDQTFIQNRLWDLLDSHIVVGGFNSNNQYYITKANDFIKTTGSGASIKFQGGGDIQSGSQATTQRLFEQNNGKTYFIDKPIQPSLRSVHKILAETPEFSAFYTLLNGVPDTCKTQIFALQGVDFRVKFFNAFHYTVYVPTNQAIQDALSNHTLYSWDEIAAMPETTTDQKLAKSAVIQKMIRFLKYHFQDNAVFFGQAQNDQYQSATLKDNSNPTYFGTAKNKYYKIGVNADNNSMTLTMDSKTGEPLRTAHVVTSNNLYNIIAKDYIFAKTPVSYKNIDGTGAVSAASFGSSSITTSASAVIHQIDNILTFE